MPGMSASASPVCPVEKAADELSIMRLLAFEKVECNCTSFPNVESVIIPAKFADRDIAEMMADIDIQSNKEDSDGAQEDEQYKVDEDKHSDEQDEDMEKSIESEEYTEVMKMKGRSYHEHFQSYLKVCKETPVKNEQPEVRFFSEPANRRDENAIVLQAKVALHTNDEAHWGAIGYVPGPKVPKVTLALRNNELKKLSLKKTFFTSTLMDWGRLSISQCCCHEGWQVGQK